MGVSVCHFDLVGCGLVSDSRRNFDKGRSWFMIGKESIQKLKTVNSRVDDQGSCGMLLRNVGGARNFNGLAEQTTVKMAMAMRMRMRMVVITMMSRDG